MRKMIFQFSKKNTIRWYFLQYGIPCLLVTKKILVLKFLEMKTTVFFRAKKLMEIWYLLITEKFLFWTFQRWETRYFFWAKKLAERWYLLITEKFLFFTFLKWKILSFFFEPKSWWKDIYWLLKSSCFELLGYEKHCLFSSQKVDGKIIFTWSFWAFDDIPGLGEYVFSPSDYRGEPVLTNDGAMISKILILVIITVLHLHFNKK